MRRRTHIEHRLGHGSAHLSLAPALAAHGCALLRECQGNKFLKAVLLDCRLNASQMAMGISGCPTHTHCTQATLPPAIKLLIFKQRSRFFNMRLGKQASSP